MNFFIHLPSQLREHLRALRKTRGLTQAALGQLLGVGQARIAEIESNPGAVSVDQLMKVLSALRASLVLRDDVIDIDSDRPAGMATSPAAAQSSAAEEPVTQFRTTPPPAPVRSVVIRTKKGSW